MLWMTSADFITLQKTVSALSRKADTILADLGKVINNQGTIMSALDDLRTAVTQMLADVAALVSEAEQLTAKVVAAATASSGVDPAAVEAQAQALSAAHSSIQTAVTAAQAALNPPAPPATPPA